MVYPGDENTYKEVVGDYLRHIIFIGQKDPFGYGHAIYSSADFVGNESFLHLVGDHLYVSRTGKSCAAQLVSRAEKEECSISEVSAIRESSMPNYGVIGGKRVKGFSDLYEIENMVKKPTPTEAEQKLFVPGLRSGHYLCFFGMHVLTPSIFKILENKLKKLPKGGKLNLSESLNELSGYERYLALEKHDIFRINL